ncbi:MAG: hypothetical protein AAGG69_16345 [Pseudomonadota bacterium]
MGQTASFTALFVKDIQWIVFKFGLGARVSVPGMGVTEDGTLSDAKFGTLQETGFVHSCHACSRMAG